MRLIILASIACLAVLLCRPLPVAAGGEAADSVMDYSAAIERAEEDLRALTTEGESRPGWGLSEALSIAALAIAIVFILFTAKWTRGTRFSGIRAGEMRILDRLSISRHSTLFLIRLRSRDYWIAESQQGVAFLADVTPPGEKGELPGDDPVTPSGGTGEG